MCGFPSLSATRRLLFLAAFILSPILRLPSAVAQPAVPPIGLQGLLLDGDGALLTGSYDLTFRLYDASEGGAMLWQETHTGVLVSDGVYAVGLGISQDLPPDVFAGPPRYLEVSVGGEVQRPRIPLRAVPVAHAAQTLADGALQAGSNVSIMRQPDGTLRIDATGGGGGSGLSSVASDATLAGDGTPGTPLGLADRAVTGAKLADGSLQAGANVTITRQNDGSLEIASTGGGSGFSLPFAGSTSSGDAALSVANTGSGDALVVPSAGRWGLYIAQAAGYGVRVEQANDGVNIGTANGAGMVVGSAGRDGVQVTQAGNDGVFVGTAGRFGLNVDNSVRGVDINTTSSDGMVVRNAGRHGLYIQNGASNGMQIDQAGNNGIQVDQTTFDGIQIQNAGRDGIRVGTTGGFAGNFGGDVNVSGTLTKGGGSFKIDHPLDPANRYLAHSFVESPDMMNVYNGNVTLDAAGKAVVTLPAYFEALNRDFRYQLTCIGGFAPVYVADEIRDNRFTIAGGTPGLQVSWQVTGIRQDAWANAHRIVVEEDKPAEDRGYFLHPRLFNQPETRNVVRLEEQRP